jgi:hypothetical protein
MRGEIPDLLRVVREVAASNSTRPCFACPWYVAKWVLKIFDLQQQGV